MDRTVENARAQLAAVVAAARTEWTALISDSREKTASIALLSLVAATGLVWGVASLGHKSDTAPVVVTLNTPPAAEAPAAPPAPMAEAPAPQALPAPPEPLPPTPVTKAEPRPEPAKPEAKPATKETKIAKATETEPKASALPPEPKIAALPPEAAAPDAVDATGALSSAKTPVDGQARSYEAFASDIDRLSKMEFKTPKDVKTAFDQLLKHQPEKLAEGWIAHSARVVAANETFSKAIDAEVEKRGRDTVLDKIARDPKYVNKLPGAYEALDGLMKQLARDTTKLSQLGDRFIQTAYAFQKKKWGEADILPRPHYAAAETARVIPAGLFSRDEEPAAPVGVTQRVLLLAASLDAGGSEAKASPELMKDPGLAQCMRWARLNLNQCLAAAYFPSEQAYCTGKHAINEVNACWTRLLPSKS